MLFILPASNCTGTVVVIRFDILAGVVSNCAPVTPPERTTLYLVSALDKPGVAKKRIFEPLGTVPPLVTMPAAPDILLPSLSYKKATTFVTVVFVVAGAVTVQVTVLGIWVKFALAVNAGAFMAMVLGLPVPGRFVIESNCQCGVDAVAVKSAFVPCVTQPVVTFVLTGVALVNWNVPAAAMGVTDVVI